MRVSATVSSKGQVTIPLAVRRRLGLQQGDQVDFIVEDGLTILRPARGSDDPFKEFVGALGGFADVDEINAWVSELRDEE